ncbi:peptidoglycan D,D-transpeptidase FtsI family protein [Granulicoccus phenolivorans]|uniref:peptidoglycan D,D-transpeptidase FtsI family protein n=1 Tax=Granulicoccus phenolivorans TaxID=266854 RepID=UPI000479C003|nr:penicillin-binding protein 2 [Granulicoccus phenolivorans]
MNGPLRRLAVFVMVLFALLLINSSYTIVVRQNDLNAHPQNRRARDDEFSRDRGPILVGQEQVATTEPSQDQYRYQRVYPDAKMYAPITGYYSYDFGRSGLEYSQNSQLSGTDDSQFVRRMLDIVTGEKPAGATVETTINPDLQQAAYQAMGNRKGAVVALDPKTGAVLAMVSTPSYDPNDLASHDRQKATQAWSELNADSGSPLSNRAVREVYPPGSVFKLVTAAAALENGHPVDQPVDAPETLRLPGSQTYLGNQLDCGGTKITIEQAMKVSCNTAFANLGLEVGSDKLRAQAEKFGFGSRPLPELSGVASRFPASPNEAQTALSAIGQYEVAASPLQMAMVTAAIANGGDVYEPYVVSKVRAADLSTISTARPQSRGRAVSPSTAQALQKMMVATAEGGTATPARISGRTVGGKTGTAQTSPERPPYAWFTSYALNDKGDPAIAVTVFVEDADVARDDISGGRLAAPVAKAVMEAAVK